MAQNVVAEPVKAIGFLDGKTFRGELGPVGKPADVEDIFVFEDGTFLSKECERRCNYPASAYFVRRQDDGIAFVSETRCPTKDATIVWRGVVDGETVSGRLTWTVKRWYWTVEKEFWFSGTLEEPAKPIASN